MPLEPLLPLFHRLDRQYFDASLAALINPPLLLRWSDGRLSRTAGFYRFGPGISEIVLSRVVLVPLPPEATLSTLCHEMIHAWVDRVVGVEEAHGPHFRARMAAINGAQADFKVSIRHRYPLPASTRAPRWLACCPNCGVSAPYRRRVQGLACRLCCDRLHGGRWHASCLLRFEQAA